MLCIPYGMKAELSTSLEIHMKLLFALVLLVVSQISIASTGPYEATIKRIQATSIGNPYNTVYLNTLVSDSPCSSTNTHDRFTLANEVQYSMVLAAYMAGKSIKIYGTGECVSDIEQINNMQLHEQ